jgi:hypothetical protein
LANPQTDPLGPKKHMNKCACINSLRTFFCVLLLAAVAPLSFGQGAKVNSPYEPIEDKDADHPQLRALWFQRGRSIPGESAAALRYRAHLQKMQMRAARIAAQQAGLTALGAALTPSSGWAAIGPAPMTSDASGSGFQDYSFVSGRATAVAIDPADPTGATVYIGGAYGGVWKSTNATSGAFGNASGVLWTPVTDTQATLAVGSIAIQPGNNNPANSLVLVGTGEISNSADAYYGLGMLRSTNGGDLWTLITSDIAGTHPFAGLGFSKIAFSTANPSLVVAGMASTTMGITENLENTSSRGIYVSTNAGSTWTFATIQDSGVTISPSSATSVVYNATAGKFFAAVRNHGFYSSPDGITWSRLATQPGSALTTGNCPSVSGASCPMYRGEMAVVPGRNEMYVWFVDVNETDQGIFKSTNGGSSWTPLIETGITSCAGTGNPGGEGGCGTQQGSYNLDLLAEVNGSGTDLYAGAINIYKCTITSANPTCSANPFINLTHVYGCLNPGQLAHVHPDQHGLASLVASGKDVLYFANDGGINRALDGYTGLNTNLCTGTNQFDSLNQTLGSMTQFVSFSQHPTDPNTLLGGTQDNGSPATGAAQSSTQWMNTQAGDGGYNAISPATPVDFFTTFPDVGGGSLTIGLCTTGPSCHSQDYNQVVSSATVGNDDGSFYFPWILDPQNSGEMLVGTCRVWRGTTSGTSFVALSNDFEPGALTPCTGFEVNLVRSLAAGGPTSGGFSNVIYAGTEGFGTLSPTNPAGGHIWVTVNAAGGTSSWVDRTGTINPGQFPVSSIAIDTSDASGNTAYVTLMGFHVSHVFKTTNAGATWTDFGGTVLTGLPDAPANAVVVDPGLSPTTGTVYVGTDVGVFSASTGSSTPVTWTEVGPAPGTGVGYLPNVAVTALRLFNSAGTKLLRASTYGRGIWEFSLATVADYSNVVSDTPQTIFPAQNATFHGTLSATNGYNSAVALTCTGGKPTTCTLNPTSQIPTPSGAAYTVTATGAIGDYSFNAHGVGADPLTQTHDAALTLHVIDFGIGVLAPNAVIVNRPSTSQNITFQVTGSGSFAGTVNLTCTGLPVGATCNFLPSAAVNPTSASPVTVTLTIGTTTSTPAAISTVVVTATTSGAPAAKTQNLSLTVTANPDYVLALTSSASASAAAGSQGTYNATLTSINSFGSVVNVSCGAGAPPTCTPVPASVTPTAGGATFTVTVSSNAVQNYNFNITGTGGAITHSAAVSYNSTFDYTIADNSGPQTVKAGLPAAFMIGLTPTGTGNTFPAAATLTCTGLPAHSSCSSAPLAAGSGAGTVTLTINTIAPTLALRSESRSALYALWLPLPGLVLLFGGLGRRKVWRRGLTRLVLLALVLVMISLQGACGGGGGGGGGGGNPGTTKGTFAVMVTAASAGSPSHAVTVMLTVQ